MDSDRIEISKGETFISYGIKLTRKQIEYHKKRIEQLESWLQKQLQARESEEWNRSSNR